MGDGGWREEGLLSSLAKKDSTRKEQGLLAIRPMAGNCERDRPITQRRTAGDLNVSGCPAVAPRRTLFLDGAAASRGNVLRLPPVLPCGDARDGMQGAASRNDH